MFEDYRFHQKLKSRHLHVLLLPQVGYYVKGEPRPEPIEGSRLVDPLVCTGCPRTAEAAASDEFALARWRAAGRPGGAGGDYFEERLRLLGGEPKIWTG